MAISNFFISIFDKENNFNNFDGSKKQKNNGDSQIDDVSSNNYDYFEDSSSISSNRYFNQENYIGTKILSNANVTLLDIFKNENIFEELENKYLNGSNFINHRANETNENNETTEINYGGVFSNLKRKTIVFLLDNKFYKIKSSEDLFKLVFFIFILVILISFLINLFLSFELSLVFLLSFLLVVVLIIYFPKIQRENNYSSISKELPYALRQLSTELRAGKSLFDALDSVVKSDYGVLSIEFSRVLEEIKYGETSENAFLNLEKRVDSKALSRVIYEILASLRIGSNLSNSLNIIAEDVSFDIRIKLKEYSEKLNAFIMIYTFLAILAPVIVLTMLLAASVVIGDLVPGDLVLILYGLFFPMVIVFLAFMIKKLEPKI